MENLIKDRLRGEWEDLKPYVMAYSAPGDEVKAYYDKYFDNIVRAYTSPTRHYHNLQHILKVIQAINKHELISTGNVMSLKLAAFFHDIVYVPTNKDNEEKSSLVFEDFALKIGLANKWTEFVIDLIMATTHTAKYLSYIGQIMCDADLFQLASDNYMDYSIAIKKEYSHLSDEEWREGRMKFLDDFMSRPWVYRTDLFRESFEDKAMENLAAEYCYLKELEDGIPRE